MLPLPDCRTKVVHVHACCRRWPAAASLLTRATAVQQWEALAIPMVDCGAWQQQCCTWLVGFRIRFACVCVFVEQAECHELQSQQPVACTGVADMSTAWCVCLQHLFSMFLFGRLSPGVWRQQRSANILDRPCFSPARCRLLASSPHP